MRNDKDFGGFPLNIEIETAKRLQRDHENLQVNQPIEYNQGQMFQVEASSKAMSFGKWELSIKLLRNKFGRSFAGGI